MTQINGQSRKIIRRQFWFLRPFFFFGWGVQSRSHEWVKPIFLQPIWGGSDLLWESWWCCSRCKYMESTRWWWWWCWWSRWAPLLMLACRRWCCWWQWKISNPSSIAAAWELVIWWAEMRWKKVKHVVSLMISRSLHLSIYLQFIMSSRSSHGAWRVNVCLAQQPRGLGFAVPIPSSRLLMQI